MKKLFLMLFFGVVSVTAIVGCGGGGGSAPPPPPVVTTAAAGLWTGTVTDASNVTNDFRGVASTDGQLRFIVYSGQCAGTQYSGTFSMNGNTGSGSIKGYAIGGCVFTNGTPMNTGTINFTISGTTLTGTAFTGGDSGSFNLIESLIASINKLMDFSKNLYKSTSIELVYPLK